MPIAILRIDPVLAIALAVFAATTPVAPTAVRAADRYIAPTGLGSRTGESIDHAAPFSRLDEQIAAAGAGGRVLFRTDLGPYKGRRHAISHGGEYGAPVELTGTNAAGEAATIRVEGNGKPFFELMAGADHLHFAGWAFSNTGQGALRIRAEIAGLTLDRIDGTNLRQLVDTDEGAGLRGFRFSGLTSSGFSKAFVGLRNATHGLIENCDLDSNWQDGDPIPEGIHIDGLSYDITIRDVTIRNIVYSRRHDPHTYWNGDGIATERETRDIYISRVRVDGASDSGFDLKGGTREEPHVIVDSVATNVKRGLRVWGVTIASDVDLENIGLPSVTLEDGSILTQTLEAGEPMAVQVQDNATLIYRRIELDGRAITRRDIERGERARVFKLGNRRARKVIR